MATQDVINPSHSPGQTLSRPIRVESLLQISLLSQVVLSTLLLSMGQQNLIYAFVALVMAITSFVITDLRGYIRLGRNTASLASLLASVVLGLQMIRNPESQLLNVANILVYLQIISMFQQKDDRIYWSLLALSLLQVIVASALNLGLPFGILLGFYLLNAIATLSLFYVLRQIRPFLVARRVQTSRQSDTTSQKAKEKLIVAEDADPATQILNRGFRRRLIWMLFITSLSTIVVFFAIPRFTNSAWEESDQNQVSTVGFTEEVDLSDMSRILESPEQVMRVEFTTLSGRPYQVDNEPYLRGTVLSEYRYDHYWRQFKSPQSRRALDRNPPDASRVVQERITLQPGSHSVLFNVAPCYAALNDTPDGLQLNRHTRQLTLSNSDNQQGGVFRYTLSTTAFRNGWQKDLIPVLQPIELAHGDQMRQGWTNSWIDRFPALTETATQVLEDQDLTEAGMFEQAKALEAHFRTSRLYTYSLDGSQNRDLDLDPIEDFIANHRSGHCEYFASALTLMLRSRNIPARLVVGYRGGDFNTVGNYYIVRQLHAHAWVEAYLPPDAIPIDDRDLSDDYQHGAWLRLDPTPGDIDVVATDDELAVFKTMREIADYCQVLWDDYVLGLNSTRQQQAIYEPLIRQFQYLGESLFTAEGWRARIQYLNRMMRSRYAWIFTILLVILAFLAYLFRQPLRRAAQVVLRRVPRMHWDRRNQYPRLDLYDQMERMLSRYGYKRVNHQTPFEFAEATGGRLAETTPTIHVAGVPRRVANAHYRVRFGDQPLSSEEHRQLRLALGNLEKALYGN